MGDTLPLLAISVGDSYGTSPNWWALILTGGGAAQTAGTVTVGGSAPSTIAATGSYSKGSGLMLGAQGSTGGIVFNVGLTGAAGPDLTISAPLVVAPNPSGPIGGSLTKTGLGTLLLSGENTYTGPTTVDAGTLAITSSAALPSGTSLTVAAGGTFIFDPSLAGSPVVGSAVTAGVAAVPEPGTMVLLLAALWSAAAYRRLRSRREQK